VWDTIRGDGIARPQILYPSRHKQRINTPCGRLWFPLAFGRQFIILTMASSFLTLGAFIWAILIRDGAAALALFAMSSASTLIGIASHWRPRLATRPSETVVPK